MPQKYTQIGLIIANHTKFCCERDAEGKVNLLRGHCRHIWHRSHNSDFGSPNSSFPASPIAFLVNSPSYRLLVLSLTFLVFFILIIPFFLFPFLLIILILHTTAPSTPGSSSSALFNLFFLPFSSRPWYPFPPLYPHCLDGSLTRDLESIVSYKMPAVGDVMLIIWRGGQQLDSKWRGDPVYSHFLAAPTGRHCV